MYWHVSATNTVSARLIGAIFLERGLVTEEQLQAALALQKETKEHLGEILVQHFGVSRIELASVLAEQWAELERTGAHAGGQEAAQPAAPPPHAPVPDEPSDNGEVDSTDVLERRPLGEIFVEQGLVTDEELDRALATQREGGEKLGEILVAQGSITRLQLASALADQWTALRKIRPPSASEPQPSAVAAPPRESAAEEVERLHEAVAALEQRLRVAESLATREPWREEIASATESLQQAVSELEARVAAGPSADELGSVAVLRGALDELANRVDHLASNERLQDADLMRRVESAADAAEAAKSSLSGAFESLSLRLADVEARVHDRSDLTSLQREVEELAARAGEPGGAAASETEELRAELQQLRDEMARRSAAASEADPALRERVEALASRMEQIAADVGTLEKSSSGPKKRDIESAVGPLVERLRELEADRQRIDEIQRALGEIESRPSVDSALAERLSHYGAGPDELRELKERLEDVERRSTELSQRSPELDDRIESLVARLHALEERRTPEELSELRATVDELAARPVGDPALADQVEKISRRVAEASPREELAELRERLEELAARPVGDPALADRVEQLAAHLDGTVSAGDLDGLRSALHELSARVERPDERLAELRARLDEVADRPAGDPAMSYRLDELARRLEERASASELEELRARLEELATRPAGDPALSDRLDELARRLEERASASELEELRARMGEIASRPAPDPELAGRVERLADGLGQAATAADLDELRSAVHELSVRVGAPQQELAELREHVDSLRAQPAGDPALSARVEDLGRRIEHVLGRMDELSSQAEEPQGLADLRASVEQLAARPGADPALAGQVERLSRQLDEAASAQQLLELERRHEELSESVQAPAGALEELRSRVEALASRPAGDPALARQVAELEERLRGVGELRRRVDELENQSIPGPEALAELSRRLDELATVSGEIDRLRERLDEVGSGTTVPVEGLDELRRSVDELASRPSGDETLAERVEELAGKLEALAATVPQVEELGARVEELDREARARGEAAESEVVTVTSDLRSAVERLGARIEAVEKLAADRRHEERDARLDAFESGLEAVTARGSALEERMDAVTGDVSGLAELRARLDELAERFGTHEREQRKGVRTSELAELRSELSGKLETLERKLETVTSTAEEGQASSAHELEQIVASLQAELGKTSVELGERVAATEEGSAALHAEVVRLGSAADATDAWRTEVQTDLERRVEELGARLSRDLAADVPDLTPALGDVRSELDALSARLEASDGKTARALDELKSDLEAVVRSSVELLDHVDKGGAGDARGLDARVDGLERRLEAQDARAEEQVRATEEALREGLSSLGRRLAETESSYAEAGDALRRSIERLGAAIVEADGLVVERTRAEPVAEDVQTGAYLAFVPNGSGYSLQEVTGQLPAVGEPLTVAGADGEHVVSRIGRSPLPLDRRRCVYLERRSTALASPDRVP
jgi:chromosome segregation ATPase